MGKEILQSTEPGLRPPENSPQAAEAEVAIAPDGEDLYNAAGEPVTVWYDSPSKTTRVLNLSSGDEKVLQGHRVKKQRERLLGLEQLDPEVRQSMAAGESPQAGNGGTEAEEMPASAEQSNLPDFAELLGLRSLKRFIRSRREAIRQYYQSEEYFVKRSNRRLRRLEWAVTWRRAYVNACHKMIKIMDASVLSVDLRIDDLKAESSYIKQLLAEQESSAAAEETPARDQEEPASL